MSWLQEARDEVSMLEAERSRSPKTFTHAPGQRAPGQVGKPDGEGVRRAEYLAGELETLSRRLRGLVTA
jgi:hypothetical protein